jgi:ketosteroid isomerase-like protein
MRTIERYWAVIEARDWAALGELLTDDVVYEMPQTRERIRGRETYLRFNAEYPGDWHLVVDRAHQDDRGGATWTTFTVGAESMPAATFFVFAPDGRIAGITDFWPEPYDPPAGREHLVERY